MIKVRACEFKVYFNIFSNWYICASKGNWGPRFEKLKASELGIKLDMENILQLSDDVLILIWVWLEVADLAVISLVCQKFKTLSNDNQVWQHLCKKKFHDYPHLNNKVRLLGWHWKTIYRNRFLGIYKSVEVLVGPRKHPTKRCLIELLGDGSCYMSKSYKNIDYPRYSDAELCAMPEMESIETIPAQSESSRARHTLMGEYLYTCVPIVECLVGINTRVVRGIFIDIQTYDPTVLLLNSEGQVFEFSVHPDWAEGWNKFKLPCLIAIPEPVKKIFALAMGNFAITESNHVYFWTITEGLIDANSQMRLHPVHVKLDRQKNRFDRSCG